MLNPVKGEQRKVSISSSSYFLRRNSSLKCINRILIGQRDMSGAIDEPGPEAKNDPIVNTERKESHDRKERDLRLQEERPGYFPQSPIWKS